MNAVEKFAARSDFTPSMVQLDSFPQRIHQPPAFMEEKLQLLRVPRVELFRIETRH